MNYSSRQDRLRDILRHTGVDAVVLFGLYDIRYLSGFSGTDGALLLTPGETVFLTDSRYATQAAYQVRADRIVCYSGKLPGIGAELERLGTARVGFDANVVSVAVFEKLSATVSAKIEWVPLTEGLDSLRACKDPQEIELMKKAADLNRQAFDRVLPLIRPGVSEKAVALDLEFALKRLGGEENSFDFIVASGVRGALPHGVASDKLIGEGELVTVDFGTRVAGYCSDETVTFAIGNISGKLRQIFDIVLEAHDSALAAVRPGIRIADLDAVARDHIGAAGFAEFFGHGLGHGVGLDIHEYPAVSSRTTDCLREGMVITIEPGIYIPDLGGVRIEDSVVVTASGYESLTSIPKQFRSLKPHG